MKKVIIDTFGADAGTAPIIKGAFAAARAFQDLGVVLIGNRKEIEKCGDIGDRIEVIETDDFITNHENPSVIFGGRDNCSVALGYKYLKENDDAIGFLSAGNTGGLLIGSICRLGLFKGIKTPALASLIPALNGRRVCLVDCGANVECGAKDLLRFAAMGEALEESVYPEIGPKVALLSVGREDSKGNSLTKEAFSLLKDSNLNFIGNVEGNDLISGYCDVVVCDGFAGNILLKNYEATGLTARGIVEKTAKDNNMLENEVIKEILNKLTLLFDLNTRGGATFLGTKKPVIKMHGCATEETVVSSVDQLISLSNADFVSKISKALSDLN